MAHLKKPCLTLRPLTTYGSYMNMSSPYLHSINIWREFSGAATSLERWLQVTSTIPPSPILPCPSLSFPLPHSPFLPTLCIPQGLTCFHIHCVQVSLVSFRNMTHARSDKLWPKQIKWPISTTNITLAVTLIHCVGKHMKTRKILESWWSFEIKPWYGSDKLYAKIIILMWQRYF